MRLFGITVRKYRTRNAVHTCKLDIHPGDVVFITGASGTGKSVMLKSLQAQIDPARRVNLSDIDLPDDRAVIDAIDGILNKKLCWLTAAGLGEVFCMLTTPAQLSEGQAYRFRIAAAMASGSAFIFADEFSGSLDRITASTLALNVGRVARKYGRAFVLASAREDFLAELTPDVLVRMRFFEPPHVIDNRGKR